MSRAEKRLDQQFKQRFGTEFRVSSFSAGGNCVAVARFQDGSVKLRDTKNVREGALNFTRDEWVAFVKGVKNNEFDVA